MAECKNGKCFIIRRESVKPPRQLEGEGLAGFVGEPCPRCGSVFYYRVPLTGEVKCWNCGKLLDGENCPFAILCPSKQPPQGGRK